MTTYSFFACSSRDPVTKVFDKEERQTWFVPAPRIKITFEHEPWEKHYFSYREEWGYPGSAETFLVIGVEYLSPLQDERLSEEEVEDICREWARSGGTYRYHTTNLI